MENPGGVAGFLEHSRYDWFGTQIDDYIRVAIDHIHGLYPPYGIAELQTTNFGREDLPPFVVGHGVPSTLGAFQVRKPCNLIEVRFGNVEYFPREIGDPLSDQSRVVELVHEYFGQFNPCHARATAPVVELRINVSTPK